tara:strand:+ start:550 stop:735 length:186 start_codon:yes stop_codon:yes gene_type:complete
MSDDYTFGNDSAEQNQIIITKRQAAYKEELGSWEQQLHMIYDDEANWRAKIAEVKAKYPKV